MNVGRAAPVRGVAPFMVQMTGGWDAQVDRRHEDLCRWDGARPRRQRTLGNGVVGRLRPDAADRRLPARRRHVPEYEGYWTAIENEPHKPVWIGGPVPTPDEVDWARFAAHTPHYVLSRTLTSAGWPQTSFLRGLDEIAALKQQPGKDVYLVGGARMTAGCVDAGLVDELRLIVYPLIAGGGVALFATAERRRELELRAVEQLADGRLSVVYGVR